MRGLPFSLRGELADNRGWALGIDILALAKKLMPHGEALRQDRNQLTLLQQEIRV